VDDADPQLARSAQPICHRIGGSGAADGLKDHEAGNLKTYAAGGASWGLAARPLLVLPRSRSGGSHNNQNQKENHLHRYLYKTLFVALDQEYLDEKAFNSLRETAVSLSRRIASFIRYLETYQPKSRVRKPR
jgi:hypothetical protein